MNQQNPRRQESNNPEPDQMANQPPHREGTLSMPTSKRPRQSGSKRPRHNDGKKPRPGNWQSPPNQQAQPATPSVRSVPLDVAQRAFAACNDGRWQLFPVPGQGDCGFLAIRRVLQMVKLLAGDEHLSEHDWVRRARIRYGCLIDWADETVLTAAAQEYRVTWQVFWLDKSVPTVDWAKSEFVGVPSQRDGRRRILFLALWADESAQGLHFDALRPLFPNYCAEYANFQTATTGDRFLSYDPGDNRRSPFPLILQ